MDYVAKFSLTLCGFNTGVREMIKLKPVSPTQNGSLILISVLKQWIALDISESLNKLFSSIRCVNTSILTVTITLTARKVEYRILDNRKVISSTTWLKLLSASFGYYTSVSPSCFQALNAAGLYTWFRTRLHSVFFTQKSFRNVLIMALHALNFTLTTY